MKKPRTGYAGSIALFLVFFIAIAFLVNFMLAETAFSQPQSITLKIKQPPLNRLGIADMYNIEISNNSETALEFYLYGTLNESKSGLVATATTIPLKLKPKERRSFKASDLSKSPDVSYPNKDNRFKEALMRKGSLPDGNYTICVVAKQTGTNEELGSDCIDAEIKIEQEIEISLLSPENKSEINAAEPLMFSWAAMGNLKGSYKIKIVEITSDESPEAAMIHSKPFFEKEDIKSNFVYPVTGQKLQPGKRYAWQVSTGNLKSEVYTFKTSTNPVLTDGCSVDSIIINTGYNHNTNTIYPMPGFDNFWNVTSDPYTSTPEPRPAHILPTNQPWGSSSITSVARWITYHPSPNDTGKNSLFDYRFRFCLADNFSNVQININMLVDDEATILVNGTVAGSTPPQPYPCGDCNHKYIRSFVITDQSLFQPGCNEILIRVKNVHGVATGLLVQGVIKAQQGLQKINAECCPCTSPTGCIIGLKWNDLNSDGIKQSSEPVLSNWQINLSNGQTAFTDQYGYYFFNQLPAGNYTVSETNQPGCTQIFPANNVHNVSLGYNETSDSNNFGNICNTVNSNPCDSLLALVSPSPLGNCCGVINLSHPQNLTGVNTIEFLPLGQNTFLSGSLGSSYTGWMYASSSPQNYTVKKNSGIPVGMLNGFFNFCLSALSSPQKIVVNWKNDSALVCSDTVTVNCDIPCVTFKQDTLVCNGSNYNFTYSIINNSNFSIGKIEYTVLSPSGTVITPDTSVISPALGSGLTSGPITAVISGADENQNICVLMKFISPDNCCWCYDTLCITTPSCICEDVSASITGDPYNCFYDLNLINNAPANYFTQVKLKTESGTMFSTWTAASGSGWGSMNIFPSNEIQYVHSSGFIPTGNQNSILNFCLAGFTTSPQKILVEWIKNSEIICVDTLVTTCPPREEPENNCAQIINESIECLSNGTFKYNFQIQNNSNNTTTGFMLNPVSPSGLTLSPANFPNVSIVPNGISAPQSLIISGAGEGVNICFETAIYKHAGQNYSWCCHGDTLCITTPVCSPPVKTCEIIPKVIEVNCKGKDEKGNPLYYIAMQVNNGTGNTLVLSSISSNNLALADGNIPVTIVPGVNNLEFLFSMSGTPVKSTCFTLTFTDLKNPKDTCRKTVCTDLPDCGKPSDCGCDKKWSGKIKVGTTNADCNSKKVYTAISGNTLITAPLHTCKEGCQPVYKYTVKKSGQLITSGSGSSFSYNFTSGTYDIMYEVFCGEKSCGECKVRFIFSSSGTGDPK